MTQYLGGLIRVEGRNRIPLPPSKVMCSAVQRFEVNEKLKEPYLIQPAAYDSKDGRSNAATSCRHLILAPGGIRNLVMA